MNEYIPIRHAYLRDDIRNILAAQALLAGHSNRSAEYCEGVADTLAAVAVALGLEPPAVRCTVTVDADDWPPAGCPRGHEQRAFRVTGDR